MWTNSNRIKIFWLILSEIQRIFKLNCEICLRPNFNQVQNTNNWTFSPILFGLNNFFKFNFYDLFLRIETKWQPNTGYFMFIRIRVVRISTEFKIQIIQPTSWPTLIYKCVIPLFFSHNTQTQLSCNIKYYSKCFLNSFTKLYQIAETCVCTFIMYSKETS